MSTNEHHERNGFGLNDSDLRGDPTEPASRSDEEVRPKRGLTIQGYEIVREIGRGNQGVVYEAIQEATEKTVAVKVLLYGKRAGPSRREAFFQEMRVLGKLAHPNIVTIYHAGVSAEGDLFFVTNYVNGITLSRFLETHQPTPEKISAIFRQLCDALQHAHGRGIVHRDLKPSNVMIEFSDHREVPRILDFGLARLRGAPTLNKDTDADDRIVGTLRYMSPEHARSQAAIDERSDIFSLGTMLYEAVTGRWPYKEVPREGDPFKYMSDILDAIKHTAPENPIHAWLFAHGVGSSTGRALARGDCPFDDRLATIILRTLEKEPERRYQSASSLGADLLTYELGGDIRPEQPRIIDEVIIRIRAFRRKHPVASFVGCLALAWLLALFALWPTIWNLVPAWHSGIMRFMYAASPQDFKGDAFENVRIVTIGDEWKWREFSQSGGDASALTREYCDGLDLEGKLSVGCITQDDYFDQVAAMMDVNVEGRGPKAKQRLCHAEFMKRLVESKCKVVAWDLAFINDANEVDPAFADPALADQAFADSVDLLNHAGVRVTCMMWDWVFGIGWPENHSETICKKCAIGGALVSPGFTPWYFALAAQRPGFRYATPSLALAAWAEYKFPGDNFVTTFDLERQQVDVTFLKKAQVGAPVESGRAEFTVTQMRPRTASDADVQVGIGIQAGDILADHTIGMPSANVLKKSTLTYTHVLDLLKNSPAVLRERFDGKIISVGKCIQGNDVVDHPQLGKIHGVFVLATMIETLVRNVTTIRRNEAGYDLVTFAGVLAGAAATRRCWRRRWRWLLAVSAVIIVAFATSYVLYRSARFLLDPLPMILGFMVAVVVFSFILPRSSRRVA